MRTRSWSLALLTLVLGATLLSQTVQIQLPSSVTVSPTDPTITELNQSLQFTLQNGSTGDVFPLPGVHAVQLDAGQGACAVLNDGTVHCWPNDVYYPAIGPLPVAGLSGITAVSAGGGGAGHTCVLLADTTVKCWGVNFFGELGDGTTTRRDTPVTVIESDGSPLTNVTAISAGTYHTCALLADTTARCWGDNGESGQGGPGQLGNDPLTVGFFSATPVQVYGLTGAVAISAGDSHTCAVLSNTTVQCWGGNTFGELGDPGSVGIPWITPVSVAGLTGVKAVFAEGFHFSCALLLNETVMCWGYNNGGQLGDGTTTNSALPVMVTGLSTAKSLSIGDAHACATLGDGTARCWGGNPYGNLGDGTTTNSPVPVQVSGLTSAVAVAAGIQHSCALLSDASVNCWGLNLTGQLGTGYLFPLQSTTPVATVPLGRAAWTSSDPTVAIMDAFMGVAYSQAFGTTTITATYGPLSASTTLTVGDFAPKITVPADITVTADTPGGGIASVSFAVTATGSPTPTITCGIAGVGTITSPYAFPLGQTAVSCTAENSAGSDTKSFTVTVTANVQGSLSISDATVLEGDSGVTSAIFRVTLSAPSSVDVTVSFATQNGTASGAIDYTITGRTVRFTPGQTTQDVAVSVIGDTIVEPDETFWAVLSNPVNATIDYGQGLATIVDDDRWLFAATPSNGPAGATVVATSIKRCQPPAGARGWTAHVSFFQGGQLAFFGSALVLPDGSWTVGGQIPTWANATSTASLLARCYAALGGSTVENAYEPTAFTVGLSTFTVMPTSGASGTFVVAQSVTPCPNPSGAGTPWRAELLYRGPSGPVKIGENAVAVDGAWSVTGRIPLDATIGLHTLEARCVGTQSLEHVYLSRSFTVRSRSFTITPTIGPAGTVVHASSVDPCPAPDVANPTWYVSLVFYIDGTGYGIGREPVQPDGSWSLVGRTPLAAPGGQTTVVATCLAGGPAQSVHYTNKVFDTVPGEFTLTPTSGPAGTTLTATSITPCPVPTRPTTYWRVNLQFVEATGRPNTLATADVQSDGSWSVSGATLTRFTPGTYLVYVSCVFGSYAEIYEYPTRQFTVLTQPTALADEWDSHGAFWHRRLKRIGLK